MKTKEELKVLKTEYETLITKLKELSEDELKQVTGEDGTYTKVIVELVEGNYYCIEGVYYLDDYALKYIGFENGQDKFTMYTYHILTDASGGSIVTSNYQTRDKTSVYQRSKPGCLNKAIFN